MITTTKTTKATSKVLAGGLAVAAITAGLGSDPAGATGRPSSNPHQYASAYRSTTGAEATCDIVSWSNYAPGLNDHIVQITCQISDTAGDSHAVYVEWKQDGYAWNRLSNNNGYGSTVTRTEARDSFDPTANAYFRVCRDVQAWPDNCSSQHVWAIDTSK